MQTSFKPTILDLVVKFNETGSINISYTYVSSREIENDWPMSELESSPVRRVRTEDEPTEDEVQKTTKKLKKHRANSLDQIHHKMLKYIIVERAL